jgi:hypothetical protein
VLVQQVLEHRNVPAEPPVHQRTRSEQRRAEGPELASRAHVGDAGRREAMDALEGAHRGERARTDDRVDWAEIEALGAQCDLKPRVLRVRCCCAHGSGCRQANRERRRA